MISKMTNGRQDKRSGTGRKPFGKRQAARMLPRAQRRRASIETAQIDNPYFNPAHPVDVANPRKIYALRNANESPLVLMQHRGTINEVQAAAGFRFRMLYERVMVTSSSPSFIQERVDGGGCGDPFNEARLDAGRQLRDAAESLSASEYWVVRAVCGDGVSLRELSRMTDVSKASAKAALAYSLDRLAEIWGMSTANRAEKSRAA